MLDDTFQIAGSVLTKYFKYKTYCIPSPCSLHFNVFLTKLFILLSHLYFPFTNKDTKGSKDFWRGDCEYKVKFESLNKNILMNEHLKCIFT